MLLSALTNILLILMILFSFNFYQTALSVSLKCLQILFFHNLQFCPMSLKTEHLWRNNNRKHRSNDRHDGLQLYCTSFSAAYLSNFSKNLCPFNTYITTYIFSYSHTTVESMETVQYCANLCFGIIIIYKYLTLININI